MRPLFLLALLVAGNSFAENYATCIIESASEVQNDMAARAVKINCAKKYPGELESVKQGSGRSTFSFSSGAECAAKKAAKTPSEIAGRLIFSACKRLYDEPLPIAIGCSGLFSDVLPVAQCQQ